MNSVQALLFFFVASVSLTGNIPTAGSRTAAATPVASTEKAVGGSSPQPAPASVKDSVGSPSPNSDDTSASANSNGDLNYEQQFAKYKKMFDALSQHVKNWGFKPPIERISDYFFQDFFLRSDPLDLVLPDIVQDLKALASSYKMNEKYDTNIYSVSSNDLAAKVLVAGARGSNGYRQQYISSVALIEANEGTSSGLAMAYVIMYPDGIKRTEAKVTNYPISAVREGSKYVISYAKGQKQQFDNGDKIAAETKVYRLVAGRDYLHFVEYTLAASAATSPQGIKSCSIAYIKNVLVPSDLRVKNTVSGFVTTNEANAAKTSSSHYGYFIVDSEDVVSLKTTAGLTKVGDNVFQSQTKHTERKF